MAEYTVRVRREQVSYADVRIQVDTVEKAVEEIWRVAAIDNEDEADWISDPPLSWETDDLKLTIEEISDEDGNEYTDVADLLTAASETEEAEV